MADDNKDQQQSGGNSKPPTPPPAKPADDGQRTAVQFADIYAFRDLDKKVVEKMYGNTEKKTEAEWHELLKDSFQYEFGTQTN